MVRVPQYVTWCTVCKRDVGVQTNWHRAHAGQSVQWRVARHGQPRICGGSGINVPQELVFENSVGVKS